MEYPEIAPDTNGHVPAPAVFPVPLPSGFPAAPAEARTTLVVCGHRVKVVLRDVDESRLMARMGGLIQSYCEGDEAHGEEDEREEDVN